MWNRLPDSPMEPKPTVWWKQVSRQQYHMRHGRGSLRGRGCGCPLCLASPCSLLCFYVTGPCNSLGNSSLEFTNGKLILRGDEWQIPERQGRDGNFLKPPARCTSISAILQDHSEVKPVAILIHSFTFCVSSCPQLATVKKKKRRRRDVPEINDS